MAAVDPIHFSALSKFFPELTELQSVHVCMLVFANLTVEQLAEFRGVARNTIKESVESIQKKLRVDSLSDLRTLVISRVLLEIAVFMFQKSNPKPDKI
ncbi:hypothetical protein C7431_11020 [Pantoea allii]|uniref:Uncharacterized protein n=1 Tax=Pantoea allii TaxID=574096 RepID=A0A2V2B595_9GAMM|nr:hypothetical protein [Pantoea allii]PWK94526.1 hypothetical protein C7431_11020 [Pantoea allii]